MKDRNIPHSVAARLLQHSRDGGESYEYGLTGSGNLCLNYCIAITLFPSTAALSSISAAVPVIASRSPAADPPFAGSFLFLPFVSGAVRRFSAIMRIAGEAACCWLSNHVI